MKKLALLVLVNCIAVQIFSQNGELAVDFSRYGTPITGPSYINRSVVNDLVHEINRVNKFKSPEELNEAFLNSIEGTPFLNNEFTKGEVLAVDGKIIDDVFLRYNVYNSLMEAKFNESLYELSGDLATRIKIEDRTFDYLTYKLSKKEYTSYLELIQDGEWKLYCRHSKKFKEAQPQKAMQDKPNSPEFRDLPPVFLLKKEEDSSATAFKSKKELINILSSHEDEIREYIKNNKVKLNDSEDLKKLISYYCAL